MMLSRATMGMLLFWAAWVQAREGYVQTRDGKNFEGHVRFESNRVVVVNAETELWAEIALTNVRTVTFVAPPAGGPPPSPAQRATALPGSWMSEDIGSTGQAGSAEFRDGAFRVRSAGTNVLAQSDSFHFVFKPVRGLSEIVARVAKVQLTHPWARAGLMMRESLAADSRNVFLSVTAARGGVFQWRDRLGEETSVRLNRAMGAPCWLKLKRDGNVFTALRSANGKQWVQVDKVSMSATKDLYVGLAVVGVRADALNESVFELVEEGPSLRNRWFVPMVQLQSGTTQMGYIETMDETAVHFETVARKDPVSTLSVANIRFQPLPLRSMAVLNGKRTGVLLNTGEFIDGECRGIDDDRVLLSSVPLGLCRFDVNSEVAAVILRRRDMPGGHPYEVKTVDGSVWLGAEVVIDQTGVLIHELALGPRHIPLHEVLELRRGS